MCYPCRCPRRSISCHGGETCCPRPYCHQRSCSTGNSRVIFPGEFQKFSDMIPPSFLVTEPKCRNVKKKSNCANQASKVVKDSDCGDKGQRSKSCDPEEPRCPEELGLSGEPGFSRGLGTGLVDCCQPTDMPWYETNCMPSQPQWVDYGCPGPVCCPIDRQGFNSELRAAGLPSKRSPPFNPCTGQVYQCANPQMVEGNPNAIGQTYNQICQGVNICFSPANTCFQFTPCNFGGANSDEANQNQPYYQFCQCANMGPGPGTPSSEDPSSLSPQGDNRSKDHRKGKERREQSVAKATKNQRHQYNQNNCEEGGNLNEANRNQANNRFYQGVNNGLGPPNPYYLYNGGDGTLGPSSEHPRSAPQGDSRSKDHRKRKEMREGNVAKSTKSRQGPTASQRHQYNQDNCEEGGDLNEANRYQAYYQYCQGVNLGLNPANPYYLYNGGDGTPGPSPQHPRSSPQPDNISKSQRSVAKATNASQRQQYNQENCEEGTQSNDFNRGQIYKDPRQVCQHPTYSGQVSQGGKRLAYQEKISETREVPRSNHHNRYNSQDCREETIDRRQNPQAQQSGRVSHQNPTAGHVSQTKRIELRDASRSRSQNLRKESIDPRKSPQTNSPVNRVPRSTHRSKSLEPRTESRGDNLARKPQPSRSGTISSDRVPRADARSRSLGKQNESRDHPSKNKPESNLNFYKQNVGMNFGPSNEHYIANYTPPDPIYTTTLDSTLCDSGSPRERNESKRGNTTRNYGQSRQESLPEYQPTCGAPYNLRFNPTIQYSNQCYSPPSPEKLRTTKEKTHNLPSNDRSQLLNRSRETGQFYDLQMPKETFNQQPVSAKKCMCKPTLSEILANEISSQPHVLLLKKRLNKCPAEQQGSGHVLMLKKQMDGQKKSPAEQQSSEPQEKCSYDYQEDDCSSSDTEEPKNSPCTEKPVNCPCKEEANYCKNGAGVDAAMSAGCTNRCGWMTCPNPWPCCCGRFNGPCNSSFIGPCKSSFIGPCNSTFLGPCNGPCNGPWNRPRSGPCNGHLCYYGNCCSGCGNCCNYRCNPCGGCFCQPSAGPAKTGKDSGKSKEKQEGNRTFHSRRLGGTAGNNRTYSSLRPTSTFGNFIPAHPTMQGYFPTPPPQYISPYSGHWQAGEVLLNPMFSNQNTLDS